MREKYNYKFLLRIEKRNVDYIRPLLDLSQSRAPFIRDSIRTDMWGPLVSGASGPKFSIGGKYAAEAENISWK